MRALPFCDFTQRANICWGINQIQNILSWLLFEIGLFCTANSFCKVNLSSVQFVPWRLREDIEKTAWTVAHTCMSAWGTLKTGEVFGHTNTFFTYHRDNYLPPTLPYCNFVHLIGKKWHTRGQLEGNGASTKYHREGDLEYKMDQIQIRYKFVCFFSWTISRSFCSPLVH